MHGTVYQFYTSKLSQSNITIIRVRFFYNPMRELKREFILKIVSIPLALIVSSCANVAMLPSSISPIVADKDMAAKLPQHITNKYKFKVIIVSSLAERAGE
ncbi:MAG: hypothetical protein QXI19_10595, partial [Candidatus Caldarchaeum sp.]